jgi:hypothetical protein
MEKTLNLFIQICNRLNLLKLYKYEKDGFNFLCLGPLTNLARLFSMSRISYGWASELC